MKKWRLESRINAASRTWSLSPWQCRKLANYYCCCICCGPSEGSVTASNAICSRIDWQRWLTCKRDYLALPVDSVIVERSFSKYGFALLSLRCSLAQDSIKAYCSCFLQQFVYVGLACRAINSELLWYSTNCGRLKQWTLTRYFNNIYPPPLKLRSYGSIEICVLLLLLLSSLPTNCLLNKKLVTHHSTFVTFAAGRLQEAYYYCPTFWAHRGMPHKTQKTATQNYIFRNGKSWALLIKPSHVTLPLFQQSC